MAPDLKSKKRKSLSIDAYRHEHSNRHTGTTAAAASAVKKSKISKSERPAKKPLETEEPSNTTSLSETKSKRKRPLDVADDVDDGEVKITAADLKKSKKAKKTAGPVAEAKDTDDKQPTGTILANSALVKTLEDADEDIWAVSDEEDVGDQSAALLEGFESTSDEDEDDDKIEGITNVPAIPSPKQLAKKTKSAASDASEGPGVIYVGRIPHGFFEHQMRAYLSQFGDINKLRLARNKKTGGSKHYAFIEFESEEVAKIVAATMNKYLLFGHILQVRMLAPEEVHKDLFKGANKRFRVVPRNRMQGRHLRLPMEREGWDKRIEHENKRRIAKEEKLSALGYEFKAPALKSTQTIPIRKPKEQDTKLLEVDTAADDAVPKAKSLPEPTAVTEVLETKRIAPNVLEVTETVTVKKSKVKSGKTKEAKSGKTKEAKNGKTKVKKLSS